MNPTDPTIVLTDPLALELIASSIPARFAYVGLDGAPRVVPVAFHWDGAAFVIGTATSTPKVAALRANSAVALTIDTNQPPQSVLLVRGHAAVDITDGVFDDYFAGARKLVPAEMWDGFAQNVHHTYPQMARITIRPTWAKLLDFQARVPQFLEDLATG